MQPTALLVDGVAVADIDEDVAFVQVQGKRGLVTFVADSATLQTTQR